MTPAALLAPLRSASGIVLAASGGPDSTALMVLMAGWADRPPVLVVTVDHALRPESADECRLVERNAAALGLAWRGMRLGGLLPGGNLQARARDARYRSLAEAAREAGYDTVVTAHHQDDQAETFMLRLARGSGVNGLGAMRQDSLAGQIRIVRPLLGVSRLELVRIVQESGLAVAHDPSNRDLRFDRVRMRTLMPILAEHGLSPERLAGTAARLARAADALDGMADALLAAHFSADRFGVVRGPVGPLLAAHEEIALRILSRIAAAVGGAQYPPPLATVEGLHWSIRAAPDGKLRRTLGGAVLTVAGGSLVGQREWGRTGVAAIVAEPGSMPVWDRRYRVSIGAETEAGLIGPLGIADIPLRADGADRQALRTAPGFFHGPRLTAALPGVARRGAAVSDLLPLHAECLVAARLGLAHNLRPSLPRGPAVNGS